MIIKKRALVNYKPEQMYALVNDIEAYPQFLSWCAGAEILSHDNDQVCARLDISKGILKKSFSTINRLFPSHLIEIRLLDGPFKHLAGFWRFDEKPNGGCLVVFDLEFEWSSMALSAVFGPIFHTLAASLVQAFIKRAKDVYGK